MTYDAFDVVVVPFPFSERAGQKRRPALVLSNRDFVARHAHVILAMITSAANTRWPSDQAIEDLASAGLRSPSVVRAKLFTLDVEIVLRRLGALADGDRARVETAVRALLM